MADQKMNLLMAIPEEVIEGSILPFLGWNDLLRFRRVSVAAKEITNGYLKTHPALAPEIEINEEGGKSFAAFLEMGIPTTKIFLNNVSGDEFYEKDEARTAEFVKKYGSLVKNLRTTQVSVFLSGKEWDFLEGLVNLQGFQTGCFAYGKEATSEQEFLQTRQRKREKALKDPRYVDTYPRIPPTFKHVSSLHIGQNEQSAFCNAISVTQDLMHCVEDLEYASFPFPWTPTGVTAPMNFDPRQVLGYMFRLIGVCIQVRAAKNPGKGNLRAFDFINYYHEGIEKGVQLLQSLPTASDLLFKLCHLFNKLGIKMLNFDSHWFVMRAEHPELDTPELGTPISSIIGVHSHLFDLNMPNLEKVEIRGTSTSNVWSNWREERPDWPALKHLDVTVDSKQTLITEFVQGNMAQVVNKTSSLLQFFFQGIRRIALTDLRLNFIEVPDGVAVPKTDEIVASCPNLKKLTVVNWPGSNRALTNLWNGLEGLEEISLEYGKDLGNAAFVGEDKDHPVFFKLARLRKLSLKGVDKMPKITDTLFSLVLRHMKLTHLTLTSEKPIKWVTRDGILSLLEGGFAESIEKFPFQDWSLAGVSSDDFKGMEAKFRSHNML